MYDRIYYNKIINKIIYYCIIIISIIGFVILFELLGKTSIIYPILRSVSFMTIDLLRNNFEFVWITSIILLIIIGILFSSYNLELVKEIERKRECFVNGIAKAELLEKMGEYMRKMLEMKDYAEENELSRDFVMSNIKETNKLIVEIKKDNLRKYSPNKIYEMVSPLLKTYYDHQKTAKELSDMLDIQIIVPNRKLEDEYRTRFERVHTTGVNKPLFAQVNFTNAFHL